ARPTHEGVPLGSPHPRRAFSKPDFVPLPSHRGVHWTPDPRSHGASVLRTPPRRPTMEPPSCGHLHGPAAAGEGETRHVLPSPPQWGGVGGPSYGPTASGGASPAPASSSILRDGLEDRADQR